MAGVVDIFPEPTSSVPPWLSEVLLANGRVPTVSSAEETVGGNLRVRIKLASEPLVLSSSAWIAMRLVRNPEWEAA